MMNYCIPDSDIKLDCFNNEVSYNAAPFSSISGLSSALQCQEACLAQPNCAIFEYLTTTSTCYLKAIADIVQASFFSAAVLGPPTCMKNGKSDAKICFNS